MLLTYHITYSSPSFLPCLVCKDDSCSGDSDACLAADIDYVVGPSCTGTDSCNRAGIGSVDSSCKDVASCASARRLSGVELINSCNKFNSCADTNGYDEHIKLSNCCNDEVGQCQFKDGLDDIVNAGCVSYYMCIVLNTLSFFVK